MAYPTLYPLRPEGIRGYFSYDITRPIAIGIDPHAAKGIPVSLLSWVGVPGTFLGRTSSSDEKGNSTKNPEHRQKCLFRLCSGGAAQAG